MKHPENYLEKADVDNLLAIAETCRQRDYLMLRVLWRTGVRSNELLHLTPTDIDLSHYVITVANIKGGRDRRIPIDSETVELLQDYITTNDVAKEHPIFTISRQQLFNIVKKYSTLAGTPISTYSLRHSYAIHLKRNGVNLRRLQQLLGHSNIQTTTVYLQFRDQDLRDVYNKVEF